MKTLVAPTPQSIEQHQTVYRGSAEYKVIRVGKNKHHCARIVDGKRKCEWIPVEELSTVLPSHLEADEVDVEGNSPDNSLDDDRNSPDSSLDDDRNSPDSSLDDDRIFPTEGNSPDSSLDDDRIFPTEGNSPDYDPITDAFPLAFKLECTKGSGIHPDLFDSATIIINESEFTDGHDAVLAIHEALGWRQDRYKRYVHNISDSQQAGAFICEDGRVWQCKLKFPLKDEKGKIRKYESPTWEVSGGSRAYLPEIPTVIRDRISHRWGIPVPHEGSFWQWLAKTPIVPIVISEGGKKGLAGLTGGAVTIALNGCFGGVVTKDDKGRAIEPTLIKDLQPFLRGGRLVYLAFDKDTNPKTVADVKAATKRLGAVAEKSGCTVKLMEWDKSQGKGLDDYLVGGGSMKELFDTAVPGNFSGGEYKSKNKKLLKFFEAEFGDRLRKNELTQKVELDGEEKSLDDFFFDIAEQFDVDISESKAVRIAERIARKNSYSPVRDYLDSLPEGDPNFLNDLATRYLGNDTPLAAKLLRRTLIAAVARVYKPGCKHDGLTIFQGTQGQWKSTFWKVLAGDWFCEDFAESNDKDEKLKLRRYWILEYAEFETAYKRKEVSALKAFITSTVDSVRRPYSREVEDFPRTSVLVGTTNETEFLRDPTGERRFWVISVNRRIPLSVVERERQQIWAAARSAYLAGEQWHLTPAEEAELMEETRQWKEFDPWQEDLERILQGQTQTTMAELLEKLGFQTHLKDRKATGRLSTILKSMGWKSKQYSSGANKGQRYWSFLSDSSAASATQVPESSDSNESSGSTVSTVPVLPVLPQCYSSPQPPDDGVALVALQGNCSATAENQSGKEVQEAVALVALENEEKLFQKNQNSPSPTDEDLTGIVDRLQTHSKAGVLTTDAFKELTANLSGAQKSMVWEALDEVDRHRLKQLATPTIGKWYEHRGQLFECIGHYPGGRGEFLSRDGKTHGALVGDYEEVDYEPYFDSKDIVQIKAEYLPECQKRYGVEEGWTYSPDRHTTADRRVVDVRRRNKRVGQREKYNFPFNALELVRG